MLNHASQVDYLYGIITQIFKLFNLSYYERCLKSKLYTKNHLYEKELGEED